MMGDGRLECGGVTAEREGGEEESWEGHCVAGRAMGRAMGMDGMAFGEDFAYDLQWN